MLTVLTCKGHNYYHPFRVINQGSVWLRAVCKIAGGGHQITKHHLKKGTTLPYLKYKNIWILKMLLPLSIHGNGNYRLAIGDRGRASGTKAGVALPTPTLLYLNTTYHKEFLPQATPTQTQLLITPEKQHTYSCWTMVLLSLLVAFYC